MDYLDHKKEERQRLLLIVGYILIGFAIIIAAIVLKYQSEGFWVTKKGDVVQSGLLFFSSHPNPADIYINDQLKNNKTNTRMTLNSGVYDIKLTRDGYHEWQRNIEVIGGKVQHFDYPFLFPNTLTTTKVEAYTSAPGLMTQSPDRRWVLTQVGANLGEFGLRDIKNAASSETTFSLPASVLSKPSSSESLKFVEWADDNKHVILQHIFDGKSEYILINTQAPEESQNLNNVLRLNPSKLTLNDKKYDQYYLYDAAQGVLQKASLKNPQIKNVLSHVLAYKTYSDDTVLYVTDQGAPTNKVVAKIKTGDKTYSIRNLNAGSIYNVDLTKYSGVMYTVIASSNDNRAYIYKDPVGQRQANPSQSPLSTQVLRVNGVNFVGFSPTAQYIVAENANRFGLYDIENKTGYNYTTQQPIDTPQANATWMDGNRLMYVSGGKLAVFDYDYINLQILMSQSSYFPTAFTPDYKYVYAIAPTAAANNFDLNQTSLRTPADR